MDIRTHHNKNNHCKFAFTLAETLITIMVIGVIATLTIPALLQQINNETLKGQRITTASKLAKGFHQMRVDRVLEEKYADTAEFVEKMKQYFKISQVCNSDNLTKCFVKTVTTTNTDETVANNIEEMEDVDNVMGLRFDDGTSMLIKYNPNSDLAGNTWSDEIIDKGKIGQLATKDGYPTYSDLFYYVVDVNNTKNPNMKNKDIVGNLKLEKKEPEYTLPCTPSAPGGDGACLSGIMKEDSPLLSGSYSNTLSSKVSHRVNYRKKTGSVVFQDPQNLLSNKFIEMDLKSRFGTLLTEPKTTSKSTNITVNAYEKIDYEIYQTYKDIVFLYPADDYTNTTGKDAYIVIRQYGDVKNVSKRTALEPSEDDHDGG